MSSIQSVESQNKSLVLESKHSHDDWINEIENDTEENDDDSFEYLYPTSSHEGTESNNTTKDEKLKVMRVGFVENVSKDKQRPSSRSSQSFRDYHSPQKSNITVGSPKRRRHVHASTIDSEGFPFIKRGKFKGFYDDRRNRCLYSDLEPVTRCNKSNCYCQHTTIIQSPLRYQTTDYSPLEIEEETSEEPANGEENIKVIFCAAKPHHEERNLGSQPKNKYSISRVRQKLEYAKIASNEPDAQSSGPVSEKFSKRMRRYHSVNNLSKRSSLNKRHWLDKYEGLETHPQMEKFTPKTHKHNYLKGFKSIDVNFHKPLTTTV